MNSYTPGISSPKQVPRAPRSPVVVAAGGMTGVPACGVIEWLAKAGITAGYPDGEFHADDAVNRQAMAAFFHRLSALTSH